MFILFVILLFYENVFNVYIMSLDICILILDKRLIVGERIDGMDGCR